MTADVDPVTHRNRMANGAVLLSLPTPLESPAIHGISVAMQKLSGREVVGSKQPCILNPPYPMD